MNVGLTNTGSIERWERERSQGRGTFIFRRGVIGWGVPAAVFTIGYKLYQQHLLPGGITLTDQLRIAIGLSAIFFPFCGYLFGRWLWTSSETQYQRFLREHHQSGTDDSRA
jgi:hypothetical protein